MASIVLTAAGYAAGGLIGAALPGVGAFAAPLLGGLGGIVGGTLDTKLGLAPQQSARGPQLESLRVQDSREGAPLPRIYGMLRCAGNVIWASPLLETKHKKKSGTKGGSAKLTTYSYAVHLATAVAAGPIAGVHRIWADSKLIYDGRLDKTYGDAVRIYPGDASQAPDALLQSYLSSGNTPAFRNTAYVVLENLQLEAFGNRIPNLTFEIEGQSGGFAPATLQQLTFTDNGGGARQPHFVADQAGNGQIIVPGIITTAGNTRRFVVDHCRLGSPGAASWTADGRATTGTFTLGTSVFASALAPDGQRLALALAGYGATLQLVIYDSFSRSFGPCVSYTLPGAPGTLGAEQGIAWLDDQTLLLPGTAVTNKVAIAVPCIGLNILPPAAGGSYASLWPDDGQHNWIDAPCLVPSDRPGEWLLLACNTAKTVLYAARITNQAGSLQATLVPPVTLGTVAGSGTLADQRLHALGDGSYLRVATTSAQKIIVETLQLGDTGLISSRAAAVLPVAMTSLFETLLPTADRFLLLSTAGGTYGGTYSGTYGAAEIALTDTGFTVAHDYLASPSLAADSGLPRGVRLGPYDFALLSNAQLFHLQRGTAAQGVGAILRDLAAQTGIVPADCDTTAGDAQLVNGFAVTQPMAGRAAIESLLAAYPFSIAESDGSLRLTDLRTAATTTIDTADLHASLDAAQGSVSTTRAQAQQIPRALALGYYDADNLYQPGTARATLDADPNAPAETLTLPLVLTAADAQALAARLLLRARAERTTLGVSLSRAALALDPGDPIIVAGRSYTIDTVRQQGGLLQLTATGFNQAALSAVTLATPLAVPPVRANANAQLLALDLPALRDSDGEPGLYLAAVAPAGWPGGIVYDATGVERARLGNGSASGIATTTLPDGPSAYSDAANTVTVVTTAALQSCTSDALLAGGNLTLLGDELLQFQTAALIAPQTYQLSTFLRGRFGTEGKTATHAPGERMIMLDETALARLDLTLADRGRPLQLSLLTPGQALTGAVPIIVTPQLNSVRPYSPVNLQATGNSGDIMLSWTRRARINGGWSDSIDLPLDQTSESYALDLYSGITLLRSITVSTSSYTYTAAQQAADSGGSVTSLTATVAQLSDRYGRGTAATASFTF